MPERIQMSRQRPWRAEHPDAVIVARPSKWGNPFRVGETGWNPYFPDLAHTRATAADEFQLEIETGDGLYQPRIDGYITVEDVRRELAGRDLACWCPLVDDEGNRVPCHADVLLALANSSDGEGQ